jgi:UDP-N-acetylmuramate dehydrogenase
VNVSELDVADQVPLAERTTLGVGGPARHWCEARDEVAVARALAWAAERGLAVEVLGGGSNVVIADRGLDGLVLRARMAALRAHADGGALVVDAGAGLPWDDLVGWSVRAGVAGIECLSGIPGDVGAAPMQNIGAYGQELASVVESVRVVERASGAVHELDRAACRFGYRDSVFKHEAADRYVVTGVRLRLEPGAMPTLAYAELARAVGESGEPATLASVRRAVLGLRRAKSMLVEPDDENRRSVGSFFLNPVLDASAAEGVRARARLGAGEAMPSYPTPDGRTKLGAGWLIERAGMSRGTRRGRVGLSSRHALSIVNLGGASAAEIVAFAAEIRARVRDRFGVALEPEPRLLGFAPAEVASLYD